MSYLSCDETGTMLTKSTETSSPDSAANIITAFTRGSLKPASFVNALTPSRLTPPTLDYAYCFFSVYPIFGDMSP